MKKSQQKPQVVEVYVKEPQTMATELREVERDIALLESRRDEIRADLLKQMLEQGVRRVDMEDGKSYIVAHRASVSIKDKFAATKWAMENPEARMSVDTSAVLAVAKVGNLSWATVEHKDYLRITSKKDAIIQD